MGISRSGGFPGGSALLSLVESDQSSGSVGINATRHDLCAGTGKDRQAPAEGRAASGEGRHVGHVGVAGARKRRSVNA